MRVTRNYRSGMLNTRKKNEQTSLLQSALARNSSSSRASRLASLLGNKNASKTNSVANRNFVTSASQSQKFYYDMKYHASQVQEYVEALKSKEKNSVYDKARESGSTAQIVSDIKNFVGQYNSMLNDLKESGVKADENVLSQLNSLSRAAEREMAETGISRKADGTFVIDEKKLEAADVDTLEKVWGGNSFLTRAASKAGTVEATAERNIEAEKSSTYSPFDRTNLYSYGSSTGNYFNSRR